MAMNRVETRFYCECTYIIIFNTRNEHVHDPVANRNNDETFLQSYLKILKRTL